MRWDRFFEDLEDQLAAEWEAERAALDSEAERLRVSRLELRDRMRALVGAHCTVEVADGQAVKGRPSAVGADWVALVSTDTGESIVLVPLHAVCGIAAAHGDLLRSARPAPADDRLARRVTFGFALRDLARRRLPVVLGTAVGRAWTGTIDRVGADHLDLAVHEAGAPRRASEVTGVRLFPFAGVAWVRVDAAAGVVLP